MLRSLLTGLPVMVLCLVAEAVFVTFCLRHQAQVTSKWLARPTRIRTTILLSTVMLLMTIGNFVQTAIWAGLFVMLGEFSDFSHALYFSGVTFATLGYGDILMSERWRLLGPMEAANGILMFGVSTAVMTAAVIDLAKRDKRKLGDR